MPCSSISRALPHKTVFPFTAARIPRPAYSVTSDTSDRSGAPPKRSVYAAVIPFAAGWEEYCSACAAYDSSAPSSPSSAYSAETENSPRVSVPVLSDAAISAFDNASSACEPLIRMPFADAPPMPQKNVSGTEMTSAHGQETTRNVSARCTHIIHSPVTKDGTTASSTAAQTTIGV